MKITEGEFILVENGESHIVGWVEPWDDAPEESSGYRKIEPVFCWLETKEDYEKAAAAGNFVDFESERKQYFDDKYGQSDFDAELPDYEVIEFDRFIANHPDGSYFVLPRGQFHLTVEEANILDRISAATQMDSWFYIGPDLSIYNLEDGDQPYEGGDADGVCMLEDGLAYGLDEEQSGGLSPDEIKIAEACFARARKALGH